MTIPLDRAQVGPRKTGEVVRPGLQGFRLAGLLLFSAVRCLAWLALSDRWMGVCAALSVNLVAFPLWWALCSLTGRPTVLLYPPALLLAHPVALLTIGNALVLGAVGNCALGGGFPLEEVLATDLTGEVDP